MIFAIVHNLQEDDARLKAKTTEKLDQLGTTVTAMLSDIVENTKAKPQQIQNFRPEGLEEILTRFQRQQTEQNERRQTQINSYFEMAKEMHKVRRQLRIPESLQFEQIRTRQISIQKNHEKTFEWAFNPEKTTFPEWLESESGIFWINGKPGSGKSTLMKCLVNDEKTRSMLQKWGGDMKVIIASHYFWNAGNPMQKSQQGLLQTLLYEVLREAPELIQVVCGDRWTTYHRAAIGWDDVELISAFNALASRQDLGIKFCFFIDGLDEYTERARRCDETFEKLLSTLKELSASPCIKICASSRPWTQFTQAFPDMQRQLRVEDITREDIRKVVTDTLTAIPKFKQLSMTDHGYLQIIETIVTRAKGVFLWVYLVLESLKKGFVQDDTIKKLQERLDKLPGDLEEYFQHMLDSIEPVYWEENSRIFRAMVESEQSLPLLAVHFLDQELDDADYSLKMATGLPPTTTTFDYETLRTRLDARGKDLLFITLQQDEWKHPFLQYRIDFLHRTVRDFLVDTSAIEKTAKERIAKGFKPLHFNPRLSLCRIMLALTKSIPGGLPPDVRELLLFTDGFMYYAWKNEEGVIQNRLTGINGKVDPMQNQLRASNDEGDLEAVFELLGCLGITNTQQFEDQDDVHWTNYKEMSKGDFQEWKQKSFLGAAIQFRLFLYVQHKIHQDPSHIKAKRGRPLLDYALRPDMVNPLLQLSLQSGPVSSIVKLLLDNGAKPNEKLRMYWDMTPWELFLLACQSHSTRETEDKAAIELEVIDVMLAMISHGADPKSKVQLIGSEPSGQQDSTADVFGVASVMSLSHCQIMKIREEVERRETNNAYGVFSVINWVQDSLMGLWR